MTGQDVSLLLAVLGGTSLLAAFMTPRSRETARDARLMLAIGGSLLAAAVGVSIS